MRTIRFLLQKEFLQIFRNRGMLPIIFVMPVIQLLVLANATTFEVRHIRISLIDQDQTATSRRLVEHLEASGYFSVEARSFAEQQAGDEMLQGRADLILHIPHAFERDLQQQQATPVQLIFNAENGATAGVAQAYATTIIADFNRDVQVDLAPARGIRVVPAMWYNPDLDYQTFMVPGILVLLVTMIGLFLSAMNIVREKEVGTIEQLNVTPIRKYEFIIGKLLPFWIIGLVELAFGLVLARVVFHVPMVGSLGLVFATAAVYLLVVLGLGLWISTLADTQQQAMFIAWFVMVIFLLMSGLFTPIESMPGWAQKLTLLNPVAYFISVMRRVLLKGAGFDGIQAPFWSLLLYAVVVLTLAVRQYRKVST